MEASTLPDLHIIHFNDVYEIRGDEKQAVCGGAKRFVAQIDKLHKEVDPLVFFSGDLWSPSKLSNIFQGENIVPVINRCRLAAACIGNHDLDFGEEQAIKLTNMCNFPWLLSNVTFADGAPIAASKKWHIVEHQGWKIGVIGLAEMEWLTTLQYYDEEGLKYDEFVDVAEELGQMLRKEQGCNFIVALTHFRVPNDKIGIENIKNVDLFLGAHDHIYRIEAEPKFNNIYIKSGADYRNFSHITIKDLANAEARAKYIQEKKPVMEKELVSDERKIKNDKTGYDYNYLLRDQYFLTCKKIDITPDMPSDPELDAHEKECYVEFDKEMEKVISQVDETWDSNQEQFLDTTFTSVRTKETSIGNFMASLIRKETASTIGFIHSGTIRADKIYKAGQLLKQADWFDITPFEVQIFKIEATGEMIYQALENSVRKWPALEGRFLQISGLSFQFDPEAEPMDRVLRNSVLVMGKPINFEKTYTVALPSYIAKGNEQYDFFRDCKRIIDGTNGPQLFDIIRKFFNLVESKEFNVEKEKLFKLEKETSGEIHNEIRKQHNCLQKCSWRKLQVARNMGFFNKDSLFAKLKLQQKDSADTQKVEAQYPLPNLKKTTSENLAEMMSKEKMQKQLLKRLRFYRLITTIKEINQHQGQCGSSKVIVVNQNIDQRIEPVPGLKKKQLIE